MIISTSLNHSTLKKDLSYNHLNTQISYVRAHLEQSPIMLQLKNTGLDFSLGKNLNALAVCIPLNHEDISSTIAEDLMVIGI